MKIKILLLLSFFAATGFKAYSRFNVKDKDIFGARVIVENKGQFNPGVSFSEKIYYGFENGDERVYFIENGLVYKMIKHFPISEKQMEALEEGKNPYLKPDEVHYVKMNWVNCNANIQIIESEKQNYYFTYGAPELNSYGYKKITYKNVYNNIDIEYTIPEDKEYGIKYNVILHPGANPADIKILYTGDVNSISQRGTAVIIKTPLESITEHAPKSFYNNGDELKSEFNLNNNVLTFNFPDGYDNTKTVTIDPWVTTLTTFLSNNYGYDVDYDYAGNTYVYGGNNWFKVGKFNQVGTLQWVFSGNITTPPWNSGTYAGNFVVDKFTGKCYTGEGFNPSGTRIVRLDAAGNYDNLISPQLNSWRELWEMGFHCASGNIYGLGGSTSSAQSAGLMNTTTGTINPQAFISTVTCCADIACKAIDNTGTVFVIYACASNVTINNRLGRINSAFTGLDWLAPSTFNSLSEAANKGAYVGGSVGSNGFNCLAVNDNFLYYYDGLNLSAYSKTTGAMIANTTISGYVLKRQGGIAVDDCNNLYIGGNNNTIEGYKFNGTTFSSIGNIPLNTTTTNKFVYDIQLDKNNNLLYVTGSGFVGTYNAVFSNTCNINQVSFQTSCQGNNNGTAVAIVTTAVGSPTFNYVWTQGSTTVSTTNNSTSNTNTVTGLANGTYTILVQINQPCGPVFVYTVNINCVNQCSAVATGSLSCPNGGSANSFSLSLTGIGGFTSTPTFTWSGPGAFNSNQQNPVFPNGAYGTYTVTISNGGCTYVTTVNMPNPIITPTVFSNGVVTCVTNAQVWANGIPAGYSYTWGGPGIVGSNTTQTINVNVAGLYTCTITNIATGCSASSGTTVTSDLAVATASISPGAGIIQCGIPATTFTGSPAPLSNYSYQWLTPCGPPFAGYIVQPGCCGTYTFEVTNNLNGCKSIKMATVTCNSSIPAMTITAQANNYYVTCVTCVTMQITASLTGTVSSGIGVGWMNGAGTTTLTTSNTFSTCTAGNYIAYAYNLAATNCSVAQIVTVLENKTLPTAAFTSSVWGAQNPTVTCFNPCVTMTGTSTALSYSVGWQVPPGTSTIPDVTLSVCSTTNQSQTTILTPSVVITDLVNGCVRKLAVPVYQDIKTVTLTARATPSLLTCNVIQSQLQYTPNPIASLHTWTWTSPPPSTTVCCINPLNTYAPGTYTLEATNSVNGCKSSQTVNVGLNNLPPAIVTVPEATIACGSTTTQISAGVTSTVGNVYYWDGPTGAAIQLITSGTPNVNMTGIYTVQITNTITGCRNENTVSVVAGAITVTFTPDPTTGFAPLNVNFLNQSTPGSNSYWGYGNGITQFSTLTINGNTTYNSPGTYTVILISQKGICIDSAVAIVVVDIPSKLEAPNVFTPNGDGINDNFILHTANLSDITATIYDRWGIKMYEVTTEKGNILWDGKNFGGKEVPAGTYFWIVKAKGRDNVDYDQKGYLTIYR